MNLKASYLYSGIPIQIPELRDNILTYQAFLCYKSRGLLPVQWDPDLNSWALSLHPYISGIPLL